MAFDTVAEDLIPDQYFNFRLFADAENQVFLCNDTSECAGVGLEAPVGCITDVGIQGGLRYCKEIQFAHSTSNFFVIMQLLGAGLLIFHLTLDRYLNLKNRLKAYRRWKKKQKQAEKDKYEDAANQSAIMIAELDDLDDDDVDGGYQYESDDENGNKVTKVKRWSVALKESEAANRKYREDVMQFLNRNQKLITKVRVEASVIKVDSAVLAVKKLEVLTMYRVICLVFLKKGSLLQISEKRIQHMAEELDQGIDMLEKASDPSRSTMKKAEKLLSTVQEYCLDVAAEIKDRQKFHKFTFHVNWDLADPDFQKFQAKVHKELHPEDAFDAVNQLMLAHGIASQTGDLVGGMRDTLTPRQKIARFFGALIPGFLRQFPVFWGIFLSGIFAIFFTFAKRAIRKDIQVGDDLFQPPIESMRGTFLPVPPYYDFGRSFVDGQEVGFGTNLSEFEPNEKYQKGVPMIYAFMHCALYFLMWIPIPMWRGILRDVSLYMPSVRTAVPIDQAYFFHKLMGMGCLSCIIIGAWIMLLMMKPDCDATDGGFFNDHLACTGFDQDVPFFVKDNKFEWNPLQNVVSLRRIVMLTWFPVFPMLHWGSTVPKWAPGPLKHYWYDTWFYLHHFVAHVSVVIALISRWEVFYPTVPTWAVYYLDKLKEHYFNTATTEIVIRPVFISGEENPDDASSTTIHLDDRDQPNSMRLLIEVPANFHVNAGQWIYLKVPEISEFQWHPFSLASASRDNFVELHIGIRCNRKDWKESGMVQNPWVLSKGKTWTYMLYVAIRERIHTMATIEDPARQAESIVPLYCKIRGPYGSTFTKCFDSHYYASVIIGAGTGLTAAESVLRELFWRKRQQMRVPKYAWFIWSCSRVDDLLWAWSSLHGLIYAAVKDGTLKLGKKWTPQSLMIDWLGIYFYVSRANEDRLNGFRARYEIADDDEDDDEKDEVEGSIRKGGLHLDEEAQEVHIRDLISDSHKDELLSKTIHQWMGAERRLFKGSMDDPDVHVEKLFAWARLFVDVKAGKHKKMASCFCGPPGLANVLDKASRKVSNGSMQFSSDHQ